MEEKQALRFSYTTSYEEIIDGLKIAEKATKNKYLPLITIGSIVVCIFGIFVMLRTQGTFMTMGLFVFCAGIYTFTKMIISPVVTRKRVAKRISQKGLSYEIEFDSIEMYLYINGEKKVIPYRNVFVRDSEKLLVILISSGEVVAIPKKYLEDKEQIIVYLLKNNVGSRYQQI